MTASEPKVTPERLREIAGRTVTFEDERVLQEIAIKFERRDAVIKQLVEALRPIVILIDGHISESLIRDAQTALAAAEALERE